MLNPVRQSARRQPLTFARSLSFSVPRKNILPPPLVRSDPLPTRPNAALTKPGQPSAVVGPLTITEFPLIEDPLLHFFSSLLMVDGKRKSSDKIVARALLHIHALTRNPPLEILRAAVAKASPFVRVRSIRQGGKTIYHPVPLTEKQRTRKGILAMIDGCAKRNGKTIAERLAREAISIVMAESWNESDTLMKKKREHEFVMLNRCVIRSCLRCCMLTTAAEDRPTSRYRESARSHTLPQFNVTSACVRRVRRPDAPSGNFKKHGWIDDVDASRRGSSI
jgi:small subunit ribosomal protein S7